MNYFADLLRRAARRRTLSELLKLDDHLLRDIGVTPADVTAMRRGLCTPNRSHE